MKYLELQVKIAKERELIDKRNKETKKKEEKVEDMRMEKDQILRDLFCSDYCRYTVSHDSCDFCPLHMIGV